MQSSKKMAINESQTGITIHGVNILKPPNHVILQQIIYHKTRLIHMQHATAICRKNLHRRGTKPRPSTGPLPNIPSPPQLHCTTNQSLKQSRRSCPGYPSVIDRIRCIRMPCIMQTYEKTSPPGGDETGFLTGGSVASHGRGVTNVLKKSCQTNVIQTLCRHDLPGGYHHREGGQRGS